MSTIAAMFDTRGRAENAIGRLLSAGCRRDAMTFLPEEEIAEIASSGSYDWRTDRWGVWRALAKFGMHDSDRYSLAEGMNRGGAVLLVAAEDDQVERYSAVITEAGAVDLDEREVAWRKAGWDGIGSAPTGVGRSRWRHPNGHVRLF